MADAVVIGLLLTIIFAIIAIHAPEILIYLTIIICVIILVVCLVVGVIMFIHDPWGCVSALVFHNPLMEFVNTTINTMPMINRTVTYKVI
jgi:hypothetical protein